MGAPPPADAGKGGKGGKGPPPAPKAGKGEGKGNPKGPPPAPVKADPLEFFFRKAQSQQEDGRWDADAFLSYRPPYPEGPEREAFKAECPGLSTAMMLEIGQFQVSAMFAHTTKQVVEVKMGDGRSKADQAELAQVELSEEELKQRNEDFQAVLNTWGLKPDFIQRAEAWLDALPAGTRPALEERAREELAKHFKPLRGHQNSREKEAAKPKMSDEERKQREEARKAKEAELREKERKAAEELKLRLDHFKSLAPADVRAVPWTQARNLHFLGGGSGGVMLVDLADACVVLKVQGRTAANEMLAERVADLLKVPVAHVRVVKQGDEEFEEIKRCAAKCTVFGTDEALGLSTFFGVVRSEDDSTVLKEHDVGVGFFGVLEFVGGHALMGMDGNKALQAPSRELLRGIGRLCALDVLINNLDRMPLPVWQNEGNLGNVMIIPGDSPVKGIDQQVNPVMQGPGMDSYLEKVAKLVAGSMPGGDSSAIVAKLRSAMAENCGAELSDTDAQVVVEGLHECLADAAASWQSGELRSCLEEGRAQCLERLTVDGPTLGNKPQLQDLDGMRDFVIAVAEHIDGVLKRRP